MRAHPTTSLAASAPVGIDPAVRRDADRLLRQHGPRAREAAGLLAWQEDIGLRYTPTPGHWDRVKLEIAERDGHRPRPGSSARIQSLHLM